jgi:hypothetical protein
VQAAIVEHLEPSIVSLSAMRIEVKKPPRRVEHLISPLALLLAKLDSLRPAQKPIDRNVKPICYSQPVNVKRAEARVLKVDSPPAARPNA